MLRKLIVLTVAALGMSLAGLASAATQTVTYSLYPSPPGTTGGLASHFDALTPTPVTNLAPITGTITITFEVTAPFTLPPTGSLTFDSLITDTDLGAAGYGGSGLGLSGVVHAVLVNPITTTQTHGVLASVPATFHLSGTITCPTSATCAFLGVPPSTTLNVDELGSISGYWSFDSYALTTPLTTVLGSLVTTGNAILIQTPEPGTLLLLGVGLAGFVAATRRRRS